jgi:hypothetical protein
MSDHVDPDIAAIDDPPAAAPGLESSRSTYTPEEIEALRITRVFLRGESLYCWLSDGNFLRVPFAISPALSAASQEQRFQWRITPDGQALVWRSKDLKEALGLRGVLTYPDTEIASF